MPYKNKTHLMADSYPDLQYSVIPTYYLEVR